MGEEGYSDEEMEEEFEEEEEEEERRCFQETMSPQQTLLQGPRQYEEKPMKPWSSILWLVLKFCGIFYHRPITISRRCLSCSLNFLHSSCEPESVQSHGSGNPFRCHGDISVRGVDILDPLAIEFESYVNEKNKDNRRENKDPESRHLMSQDSGMHSNEWGRERFYGSFSETTEENLHAEEDSNIGGCDVCESNWWNYKGVIQKYNDSDIGLHSWNHRGSGLLSVFILLLIVCLLVADFLRYSDRLWGNQQDLIRLLSYLTCIMCLLIYPIMGLLSKYRSWNNGSNSSLEWTTSLNMRFIIKQLQYLNISEQGLPRVWFLLLCTLWPAFNAFYRIMIYTCLVLPNKPFDAPDDRQARQLYLWSIIKTVSVVGVAMLMWGCSMYLTHLLYLSFKCQLPLVLKFLKMHEGDLDRCRNKLGGFIQDFNCFRHYIDFYMAYILAVSTWSVTTTITWQYMLFTKCYKQLDKETKQIQLNLNFMIWSETLMFFVLSIIAIGGKLDVSSIWKRLHRRLVEMRNHRHNRFWEKLTRHVDYLGDSTKIVSMALVFSVIGFYMGLQFGDQDLVYLSYDHSCKPK